MIRTIFFMLIGSIVFTAAFILLEKYAENNPEARFTRWWRKNIVSDTHTEE